MTLKRVVLRISLGQLVVTLACVLLWFALAGVDPARAALAGALVAIVPWLVMAAGVLRRGPGATPGSMLSAFYLGGALKFLLTVVLFAVALAFYRDQFTPLITTFVGVLAVHWFALPILSRGL